MDVEALPNYPTSLDACREFEQTIKDTQQGYYNAVLFNIATNRNLSSAIKEPSFIFQAITATPLQRCEAFLRLHNKWIE